MSDEISVLRITLMSVCRSDFNVSNLDVSVNSKIVMKSDIGAKN